MALTDALASISGAAGPISLGVSGAIAAAQLIKSGVQNREAKKMQSNLVRPIKRIERGYSDNLSLAESGASQGIGDAAMTVYENNMDRALTTGVDAILRGGGSVNSISDLYDNAEDNFSQLALLEEEVRQKKAQVYMAASEEYAAQEEKNWQVNEYGPYKDKLQAIAVLKQQASQNQSSGLNTLGAGVNNFLLSTMGQKQINDVFPKSQPAQPSSTNPNITVPKPPETVNAYLKSIGKGINVPGVSRYLAGLNNNFSEYIDPINF